MKFLLFIILAFHAASFVFGLNLPSNEQMTLMENNADPIATKTPYPTKNQGKPEQNVIQQELVNDLWQLKDDPVVAIQEDPPLNGNTFFIFNKHYSHARLTQFGNEERDIGPYELGTYPDQLWCIQESLIYPGYYYISNAYHQGYRLAKWSPDNLAVIVFNGNYYDDQLWKFQKEGDSYRIFNKVYSKAKLTQFGKEAYDIGTYDGSDHDDQLWRLVPRFKAKVAERTIWSIDNRQGTGPITREFTISSGVTLSNSKSISTTFGFELSLTSSLYGMEASTTFSSEISQSITNSEEKNWSKQVVTTYTAPAGKFYRVQQYVVSFTSAYSHDDCALYSSERIEEHD